MPSTNGHGPKRVILYTRVSGEEQRKKGYSLDDQRDALRAWARDEGYEILEEVEDGAWSGGFLTRPGLDREHLPALGREGQRICQMAYLGERTTLMPSLTSSTVCSGGSEIAWAQHWNSP